VYPSGTAEFVESQLTYVDAGTVGNIYKTNEGVNKSYQWGYNNSLPVAEVTNAQNTKHNEFNYPYASIAISNSASMTQYTISKTFTVGAFGSVSLSLGKTLSSGSNSVYADYSGTLGSGTLTLTYYSQCGYTSAYFNNVMPGTYTINITVRSTPVNMTMDLCGEILYPAAPTTQLTGITEFFYEGFEEGTATGTATPHTGKKYLIGDYTTTFVKPNARNYIVEYWYLHQVTNQWTYKYDTYVNGMPLTDGTAIDNVRIYPSDARMKSYTYEPTLGISSVIDENGSVMYYTYDSFGRLSYIKNDKGGIEKQYGYNYKTN
jgi:YD repeat-containing protein